MAIRKREGKRGNTYQIDYLDPTGKRIRQSFKTKKEAVEELAKRISLRGEGRYMDVKKEYTATLGELYSKYKENYHTQASWPSSKRFCLKKFIGYMGADTKASTVKFVDLETYKNHLKRTLFKNGNLRQVATVNRHLITLHHFFQKGVEWELIGENPFARGKSLKEKENNTRLRYLDQNEIERVLDNCIKDYVKDIIVTVLHTGMRRQEVLSLTWNQIRKDGFIYLTKTKTNEARQIPINDDLADLFKAIRARNQLRFDYVFCDSNGKPFQEIKNSFKATLERAGIQDFRFHDLRHTFASHFIMRGGSIKELQEILGHKNITMTMRYAHLSQEHKKKAVNCLNGLTNTVNKNALCHIMSQNKK